MSRYSLLLVLRSRPVRKAVTLVELLVVLGIITLLAALILPSVKGLLSDRKSSQTAIMVKNYLEGARARAIGKNRSVSVVLERISGRAADLNGDGVINLLDAGLNPNYSNPSRFSSATANGFAPTVAARTALPPDTNFIPYNTCVKLSMAEEPLPVTDKLLPAAVTIFSRYPGDGLSPAVPAIYDLKSPIGTGSDREVRIFQVATPAFGPNSVTDLVGDYLVSGNEISLDESSTRFTITSPSSREAHWSYDRNDTDGIPAVSNIFFAVQNNQGINGLNELAARPYVNIPPSASAVPPTSTNLFKIFLKPKPIYIQSLQLPKGACIDLSLSGFSNNFRQDSLVANTPSIVDYRVRFASDWVLSGDAGVPTPEELRPIHLVFSPDGKLSRVLANGVASETSVQIDCVQDVFLHVGLIDQVVMPYFDPANTNNKLRNYAAFQAAFDAGIKQNLTDPSSYVLRLSPKSGSISAAPINQFVPAASDTYFDILGKSRLGTYTSTLTGQ